ncbi:hypothetical protein [Streptomyces sp. NPDC002265]
MPGVKNGLREADVRFNTHDYDLTNKPTQQLLERKRHALRRYS